MERDMEWIRILLLGPLWKFLDRKINGYLVVTSDDAGILSVTREDGNGRVTKVLWMRR